MIILRTFSKLYGMAGLRAGAALGRPDLLANLRDYGAGALAGHRHGRGHGQPENQGTGRGAERPSLTSAKRPSNGLISGASPSFRLKPT